MNVNAILNFILSLIYPPKCLLCGKLISAFAYVKLCPDCEEEINKLPSVRCEKRAEFVFGDCSASWPYEGKYSRAVLDLKFNNRVENGKVLGIICAEDIMKKRMETDINIIIPVPLHKSKMSKRGYNQAEIIAREAGRRLGIPVDTDSLRRIKKTVPQMELNLEQRMVNIDGAMKVVLPDKIGGKSILLIDDIFTTGSTLNECAKELIKSGAKAVSCYCVCALSGQHDELS